MAIIHLLALGLCLVYPSWSGLGVGLGLYFLTGFGITVGYHRMLSHRSFLASPYTTRLLAMLGVLAGEGPPIFWVANHRKHHHHSDGPEDPHSPEHGFWWAHWLWIYPRRREVAELYDRYAPDMLRDRFWRSLEWSYILWHLALAGLLTAAGWAVGGRALGLSWLGYGFALRIVVVLHSTWLVNSVGHRWGYRNYETTDNSRNNAAVALVSLGEGWHNNHHHSPVAANHGHRWWEVDLSFLLIVGLAWLSRRRWVRQVKVYERGELRTWFKGKS